MSKNGDYWCNRPGFRGRVIGPTRVRIGPLGSRLDSDSESFLPGAINVAIFGDSVTFGQGVADDSTFAARVGRQLRAEGLSVEVLNFGVLGHSLRMELAHLRDMLTKINPDVVVLSPIADDLQREGGAHVDRFGYLTSNAFGTASYLRDFGRMLLHHSHLALLLNGELMRIRTSKKAETISAVKREASLERQMGRLRDSIRRFRELTQGRPGIVALLDVEETELTRKVQQVMRTEFPEVEYVHAPTAFEGRDLSGLRVARDGHPNAVAHKIYADLLSPHVADAIRSLSH